MDTRSRRPRAGSHRRVTVTDLATAIVVGLAGGLWLSWLDLHAGDGGGLQGPVGHSTTVLAFTLPPVLAILPVTAAALRGRSGSAALLQSALAAAAALAVGNQLRLVSLDGAGTGLPVLDLLGDAVTVLPVVVAVLVLGRAWGRMRSGASPVQRLRAVAGAVIASAVALAMVALAPVAQASAPTAATPSATGSCLDGGGVDRYYDVTATDVNIPINRFGDHDPKGKMYVLTSRLAAVRAQQTSQKVSVGLRDDAIQPLVIRANEGDCVEVRLTNIATGGPFGMHIDGLEFDLGSSGDAVGQNAASDVAAGQTRTYRFAIPLDRRLEGGHYIHPGPGNRAAVSHGLFGALVVEPPGSTYWNASVAGKALESGWEAIIKPTGTTTACVPTSATPTCGFREAALLHHEIGNDNEVLKDKAGIDI